MRSACGTIWGDWEAALRRQKVERSALSVQRGAVTLNAQRSTFSHFSIRAKAHPVHILVVLGFGGHGDFRAVGGEDAAAVASADVALVLAGQHFRMAAADVVHFRDELDRAL